MRNECWCLLAGRRLSTTYLSLSALSIAVTKDIITPIRFSAHGFGVELSAWCLAAASADASSHLTPHTKRINGENKSVRSLVEHSLPSTHPSIHSFTTRTSNNLPNLPLRTESFRSSIGPFRLPTLDVLHTTTGLPTYLHKTTQYDTVGIPRTVLTARGPERHIWSPESRVPGDGQPKSSHDYLLT